jgi:hypothetical protein
VWDVLEGKYAFRVLCYCVVSRVSELYDLLFRPVSDSLRPCELWPRRLMCFIGTVLVLLGMGLLLCRTVISSFVARWRVTMRLF